MRWVLLQKKNWLWCLKKTTEIDKTIELMTHSNANSSNSITGLNQITANCTTFWNDGRANNNNNLNNRNSNEKHWPRSRPCSCTHVQLLIIRSMSRTNIRKIVRSIKMENSKFLPVTFCFCFFQYESVRWLHYIIYNFAKAIPQ